MNMFVSFVQWSPLWSIIIFSAIISAALGFLYKKMINQKEFERLKNQQKELSKKANEHKNDAKKLAEIQKEMMDASVASMKLTFKPMIVTLIPVWFIFYGLQKLYTNMASIGNIISWPWNLPMIGTGAGWLLCYIIFSLIFGFILRKAFKFY